MFSRNTGSGTSLCGRSRRYLVPVFMLIVLSVLAQLVVFGTFVGHNYFLNKPSTIVQLTNGQSEISLQRNKVFSQDAFTLPLDPGAGQNSNEEKDTDLSGQTDAQSENIDNDKLVTQARRQLMLDKKEKTLTEMTKQGAVPESKLKDKATKLFEGMNGVVDKHKKSDFLVQMMQDQMKQARSYMSFARMNNRHRLLRDLKLQIQESQQALGDSLVDADLQKSATQKMKAMGRILSKARDQQNKCDALVKKLRSLLLISEDEAQVLKKEGTFLGQLAARTVPKGLHCLALQLTIQYHSQPKKKFDSLDERKLEDLRLYHYAILTDNILAASVIVNSTIFHAKEPYKHVFHIVTDGLNYAAMKMWFLVNTPSSAMVEVKNLDDITWLNFSSPVLWKLESLARKENPKPDFTKHSIFESLSLNHENFEDLTKLDHLRFYLPELYPKLDKILLLDDDIVVQKDLTGLWSENLHGMVNGAVEMCGKNDHHFDNYLNFSTEIILKNFNPNACAWAYCMNIFDLKEWKRQNITKVYNDWHILNQGKLLWKVGTLPPGLITFYNSTHTLDKSWRILNLGDSPITRQDEVRNAAVIHYSGHVKPWLEISMSRYRSFWTRFLNYDHPFLQECNINK